MIAAGNAFAGVVQQQSEIEQFGIFQFAEKFGIALIPFGLRLLQAMQAFDGEERMLIHGEAMIEIAHDQRVDEL